MKTASYQELLKQRRPLIALLGKILGARREDKPPGDKGHASGFGGYRLWTEVEKMDLQAL